MDWKNMWMRVFCLLVAFSVVLAQINADKKTQEDESLNKSLLKSESKVQFVTAQSIHSSPDSTNVPKQSGKGGNPSSLQIETPLVIKKSKHGSRTLVRRRKVQKSPQNKNASESAGHKKAINVSKVKNVPSSESSVPEESLRIEDIRHTPDHLLNKEEDSFLRNTPVRSNSHFASAQFVPSENFPKNLASHSRRESSHLSTPLANGKIKYVIALNPDSSEEDNSRSDSFASEEFGSRKQPQGFNNRQFRSNQVKNLIRSELNEDLARNAFPSSDAQKVTIIKEKTVHSTSSEEAQERVNIEKNPFSEQSTSTNIGQPRHFQVPENVDGLNPQRINNEEKKVILVEGTHIPGRNYDSEEDVLGFHADSYKEDKTSQLPNGKRVKIVKVIKSRPENLPSELPLNNHGNGHSRQYFVNDQQRSHARKSNFPPTNNHAETGQPTFLSNAPQIKQIQHFESDQRIINSNENPNKHTHVPTNNNFVNNLSKHSVQSGSNVNTRVSSSHLDDNQHVILNINPEPNELYLDQNTGQLIKFVVSDDVDKQSSRNIAGRTFQIQNPSKEIFSQRIQNTQHDKVPHISLNRGGKTNGIIPHQLLSDAYENQHQNQEDGVQYIEVHDDNAVHLVIPSGGQSKEVGQQIYYIPKEQNSENGYLHAQNIGASDLKDDSEEYVVLCDQEGHDISAEYQSEGIGSNYNTDKNNYEKLNHKSGNQFQNSNYGTTSGINHYKGQSLKPSNQGIHFGNKQNFGTKNLRGQKFGSRILGGGNNLKSIRQSQGDYSQGKDVKGFNSENNFGKEVTNFATPPSITGGHYKGNDFSNSKHNSKTPVYRETVTPAYPVTNDFPPVKGPVLSISQNQGNFKHGLGGSTNSYNKGSGISSGLKGFTSNNQGYEKGNGFHETVLLEPQNQNLGNNGKDYNLGTNTFIGVNKGSGISNQKGFKSGTSILSGTNAQGLNKGSQFLNSKGHNKGSNSLLNNKGYTESGVLNGDSYSNIPNKGISFAIEKGYNAGASKLPHEIAGDSRDIKFPNQKGYNGGNVGFLNNQKHNLGGKILDEVISLNGHNINQGTSGQEGYVKGDNLFSGQNDYTGVHGGFFSNEGYNSGGQFIDIIASKGDQGDNGFLNQKGYNVQNNILLGSKGSIDEGNIFSDILSSKGPNKGSRFARQKGYNTVKNGFSGNQGYQIGSILGTIMSKGVKSSQLNTNKGYGSQSNIGSGNKGYNAEADLFSNNKGYRPGSSSGNSKNDFRGTPIIVDKDAFKQAIDNHNTFKGTKFQSGSESSGYGRKKGDGYSENTNNNGYQHGGSSFSGNTNNNLKGSSIIISQNNGYNGQAVSDHNNFKGTQFQQNNLNPGYSNQKGGGSYSGSISNIKGYQQSSNSFPGNTNKNFKGTPIVISQNNDYNEQAVSDHNNFKGTKFQQNSGNSAYVNQKGGNGGYSNNNGHYKGSNSFPSNTNNNLKGTPIISQNNDYNEQAILDHNNFKGTKFQQSGANSGYGNQKGGNHGGYSNNNGHYKGSNSFPSNTNNNVKGTISQNNDYIEQAISNHNNFKGTKFQQSGANSGYGNQKGGNHGGYSNNNGHYKGSNSFPSNTNNNVKGTISQNNDYIEQAISNHNNFKGTKFQQNSANSGYGNQKGDNYVGITNNNGHQKGSDSFYVNSNDDVKGIPIIISENNDYNAQAISDHNNFKGTKFQQSGGNSGYGNQKEESYVGNTNNKGFQKGSDSFYVNSNDNIKGSTIVISENNGYNEQAISDHNNFKGTKFQQTGGNAGYGDNQNKGGYNGGSNKNIYQTGSNSYFGNLNSNLKGDNVKISGNNDYNQQIVLDHNTFKGTKFQKNGESSGYGNQNSEGYGGDSSKKYNVGSHSVSKQGNGNFKGIPIRTHSNGYDNQGASDHNTFKGTNYQQSSGHTGYSNQNIGGHGGSSGKGNSFKNQAFNSENNNYGVSYLTNVENSHQSGDQYADDEGQVQYILVHEDAPVYKNENGEEVYLLQYENDGHQPNIGNNEEKTYLILDDSNVQHQEDVRVVVNGGKEKTYSLPQLATAGLDMAKSVFPQLQNSKAKSIKGKISFGVEIKKGQQLGNSGGSQYYLEKRNDKVNQKANRKQISIK